MWLLKKLEGYLTQCLRGGGLWRLHALVGSVNGILNLIEEAVRDLFHGGNNYGV